MAIVTGNVFEYGSLYIAIKVMLLPRRLTLHLATLKLFGLSISRLFIVKFDLEISAKPPPLCISLFILCSIKLSLLSCLLLYFVSVSLQLCIYLYYLLLYNHTTIVLCF